MKESVLTGPGKIAAVTPSFNEPHKLAAWVENYQSYRGEIDLHIIVDDNSLPEYQDQVRKNFPDSKIIFHSENRGLITAINSGFRFALKEGYDYIVILLPDMKVAPDCLASLRSALENDPKLGLVCPVIIQGKTRDIIEEAGGFFDPYRANAIKLDVGKRWQEGFQGIREVSFISGGLHMLKASLLREIGLQDERLFMYGDELDFDWRVRKAGFKGGVVLNARAWHEHDYSKGSRPPWTIYLWSRNRMLVMRWHGSRIRLLGLVLGRLVTLIPSLVNWKRKESWGHAKAHLAGFIDGVLGKVGPPPDWKEESSSLKSR